MSRSWWLGPSSVALVAFASLEFTRCYDTRPQAGLRPCAPRTAGMRCLEQLLRRNLLPRRSLPAALAAAASSPCLGAPSRTHGGAAADSHGSAAAAAAAAAAASSASPAPAAMPEADASHGWTRPGRVADVAAAPACASSAAAPPLLSALLLGGAVCAAVAAGATASDEVRRAFSFCGGASVCRFCRRRLLRGRLPRFFSGSRSASLSFFTGATASDEAGGGGLGGGAS